MLSQHTRGGKAVTLYDVILMVDEEARKEGRRQIYDIIKARFLLTKGLLCIDREQFDKIAEEGLPF